MAFGMKSWLALVFLLLLGVGVWGFAPPFDPFPRERTPLPERQRFLEIQRELLEEEWSYRRLQWRDSLITVLRAGVAAGHQVIAGLPAEAPDSAHENLALAVDLQMADLDIAEPAIPIGVFLLSVSQGSHSGLPARLLPIESGGEYYVGRAGEDPFCIVAHTYFQRPEGEKAPPGRDPLAYAAGVLARVPSNPRAQPNTFRFCRHFAKHGKPGPEILAWLRSGASSFGARPYPVDYHLQLGRGPARGPFGKPSRGIGLLPPRSLNCLAGDQRACEEIVLSFEVRSISTNGIPLAVQDFLSGSPVDFLGGFPRLQPELLGLEQYLFFAMEDEFGPDRFGEFWRSTLEPAEAFEEAFGEPLGGWVMGWLRSHMDPSPRGPGVPFQATVYSLLALGLLAGLAARIGRR